MSVSNMLHNLQQTRTLVHEVQSTGTPNSISNIGVNINQTRDGKLIFDRLVGPAPPTEGALLYSGGLIFGFIENTPAPAR